MQQENHVNNDDGRSAGRLTGWSLDEDNDFEPRVSRNVRMNENGHRMSRSIPNIEMRSKKKNTENR